MWTAIVNTHAMALFGWRNERNGVQHQPLAEPSAELQMSDSAATRKQLKIKAGIVKRFVALHVLSVIQEILIRFLIPDNNTQIPERSSAIPCRGRTKPTETPIFHCHN
jgi:hypothetical protein